MLTKSADTIEIKIFIAGDLATAKQICREYCYKVGLCVTVEPTTYIYTGGEEAGVRVGLINYARFPTTHDELMDKAWQLADLLMEGLYQNSMTIMTPEHTWFRSRRKEDQPVVEANTKSVWYPRFPGCD